MNGGACTEFRPEAKSRAALSRSGCIRQPCCCGRLLSEVLSSKPLSVPLSDSACMATAAGRAYTLELAAATCGAGPGKAGMVESGMLEAAALAWANCAKAPYRGPLPFGAGLGRSCSIGVASAGTMDTLACSSTADLAALLPLAAGGSRRCNVAPGLGTPRALTTAHGRMYALPFTTTKPPIPDISQILRHLSKSSAGTMSSSQPVRESLL